MKNKKPKRIKESSDLPTPIAAYFMADMGDSETLSRCFTDDAVVKDEGQTHKGRAAIKRWKTEVSSKYKYASEPLLCEQKDGKTVVTCRLAGNFPGSPVDLRFFFEVRGEKIAFLEIIP